MHLDPVQRSVNECAPSAMARLQLTLIAQEVAERRIEVVALAASSPANMLQRWGMDVE